jgi:hypothetical protein
MDTGLVWILLEVGLVIAGIGLLVWAGCTRRYRTLRYGMFVAGLLLAAMSFLLCIGKALAMRDSFLGVVAGSTIAGGAIIAGALMSRRFVPFAAVIMGGFVGALVGWSYYRLGGGTSIMEWMLALCFAPIGMWLGWLGGASGNRVVVGAALGGAVGAMLAALAFPILFNMEGPLIDNNFWALIGLLVGGFLGSLLGAFIGWSGSGRDRYRFRE